MRARERQRFEWRRRARYLVMLAEHSLPFRKERPDLLRAALRIITIHGPVPIRREARLLLEGLK